jgi:hypothetical protein
MALEREIETYRLKLPELLARAGKYVVIHGEEVVGIFDGFEDALREGYERFQDEPFLVRQIREVEQIHYVPRASKPCP